ncbi:MAG: flagellar hook-length control protein FliK [Porticoccus sp.]|nr:flagellar hook-length control protein FliK [Porticoccus sp.]MBQ0808473.1 flagellar hook-length control protein FliK [Porticoccus sp.]
MSGITPLLDTLLPQVLGKRVDIPLSRALNQPVQPTSDTGAPRSVFSDSRLNATSKSLEFALAGTVSRFQPASQGIRGAPTQEPVTNLSPTARTIATILSNTHSRSPVIHQPQPLLSNAPDLSPLLLSGKLQASIRDSGLFYESHLANWYRGSLPRQQLDKEPQMRFFLGLGETEASEEGEVAPSKTTQGTSPTDHKLGVMRMLGQISALTRGAPVSAPTSTELSESQQADGGEASRAGGGLGRAGAGIENLQGIVSHQLELLSTPLLHWEGEVWSGVFMALLIQIPEMLMGRHGGGGQGEAAEGENANDDTWSSELALDLDNLGLLKMKITLKAEALTLWLQAPTDEVLVELEGKRESLLARLEACGFENTGLHTQVVEGAGESEGANTAEDTVEDGDV